MSIQLSEFKLRLRANVERLTTSSYRSRSVLGEVPRIPRGVGLRVEVGLFHFGEVLDLSNVASLTLQVFESQTNALVHMERTLSPGQFSATLDPDAWGAGTAEHAAFTFTAQETNVAPAAGQTEKTLFLVVWGVTDQGVPIDYFISDLIVYEDRAGESYEPAPEPPDVALSLSQALSLFALKHANAARWAVSSDGVDLYFYDHSDAKWHRLGAQSGQLVLEQPGVDQVP